MARPPVVPEYKFVAFATGAVVVAGIQSIDFGETAQTETLRKFHGETTPENTALAVASVTLTDILVQSPSWWNLLHKSLRSGERIALRVVGAGMEYDIQDAIVTGVYGAHDRESDRYAVHRVTLAAAKIHHSYEGGASAGAVTLPSLAGIDLPAETMIEYEYSGNYTGEQAPHLEADNRQYAGSKGAKITVVTQLTPSNTPGVAMVHEALVGLARKSASGAAPEPVTFTFGEIDLYVVITSFRSKDKLRNRDGSPRILEVTLELQERYMGDTDRTTDAQKGDQVYVVSGSGVTYEWLAYHLWRDERLAQAIRDYNPTPEAQGPVVAAGTVLEIPPWSWAERYKTAEGFAWAS